MSYNVSIPPFAPECTYVPPVVKHVLIRRKKGQLQVKINGKGKWINAEYDRDTLQIFFIA